MVQNKSFANSLYQPCVFSKRISKCVNFKQKFILFSFLNIFLVFRIDILIAPFYLEIVSVIGLLILLTSRRNNYFNLTFFKISLFVLAMFALGLVSIIINRSTDYTYLVSILTIFFKIGIVSFSFFVFRMTFKDRSTVFLYMKSFILTCIFYMASTFVLLALPPLYNFWIGTIVQSSSLIESGEYFYRISIKGFSGFMDVAIFAVSLFMCAYFIVSNFNNNKRNSSYKYMVAFPVLCLGCLMYGRVAFITMGLSAIYLFFATNKKVKIIKYFAALFLAACLAIGVFAILAIFSPLLNRWFVWAFEPVMAIFTKAQGVSSVNAMFRMYKFPDELKTLLLGDGRFVNGQLYYMGTDIGFLRAIYFYGIGGMLLNYSMLAYVIYSCMKLFKGNSKLKMMLVFLGINAMAYELKGVMWDTTFTYLIFFLLIGIYEKRRAKHDNFQNSI